MKDYILQNYRTNVLDGSLLVKYVEVMSSHSELFSYTISPSYTHYYDTSFTFLPGALVSLCQSSDCHACQHSLKKVGGGGALTAYYLIVPAHLTHHTNTYASIRRTEPLLPIHHLFHHHELGMRFVPSENAGGRWETEAVRKRWGETSQKPPAAHA